MTVFEAEDAQFEIRVRESFARQKLMGTIGARIRSVSAGEVEVEVPFCADLTQQHGYMHAGVVRTIIDTACGYAALSLMSEGSDVLTAEYKINFLSPATGDLLVARGRVTRPGRSLTVCAGDVFAVESGREKLIATMLATMMRVEKR